MNGTQNLVQKILSNHCGAGLPEPGARARFSVDSVLFHDMSAILAMMGYDAMELGKAGVDLPIVFNDHNLVMAEPAVAENQQFVRSCARAFGMRLSLPGNGICHSLYCERIARPGMLLIGADSHTATCGALGMIGIGMGGMDVAVAMSGTPVSLTVPGVLKVHLTGALRPGVSAKDAALTLLRELTISGALGKMIEYGGPAVAQLSVPQRMTLANMGAEMGATSSVFPTDEQVRRWMKAHGREDDYMPLCADDGACYDAEVQLDLTAVEPMIALPGRPDRGIPVADAQRIRFSQIFLGSCTNGSYTDLARAAMILKGKKVSPETTLIVTCASREVYRHLLRDGYLQMLTDAGARILECGCGPCMGIGQAPASGAKVLRTSNRNFKGRSGTPDAEIYLCGPETAAATVLSGVLTAVGEVMNPAVLDGIREPEVYQTDDSMMVDYAQDAGKTRPVYGKGIRPIPVREAMEDTLRAGVSLRMGDGISTDDIVPAVSGAMSLRSNIPALSDYIFRLLDPQFAARAREMGSSILVAGRDYAQGSSREYAAICCMALGVRAVLVKSMHRIHRSNLINYGVIPLLFESDEDYASIEQGDVLCFEDLHRQLTAGRVRITNERTGKSFHVRADLGEDELEILFDGGLIPHIGHISQSADLRRNGFREDTDGSG